MSERNLPSVGVEPIFQSIRALIESSRQQVLVQVNQALVTTYWEIGRTIRNEVLGGQRADYGARLQKELANKLTAEFGRGFSHSSLTRMAKFFDCFPELQIVVTLSQLLSWSHFIEMIKLDDPLKRQFYIEMCREGRWSVRTLRERIGGMMFERTAISKQPQQVIERELKLLADTSGPASPALFLKDPYLLDFLDLSDDFSEKDLENAILSELQRFILELGSDFAFLARQRRIQIGSKDYYLDLLFFHRKLRRLVLIELKLEEFKPEHKGKVELYLNWLAKHERQADEGLPIAILLCADRDMEVVELMDMEHSNIHIAEYWLKLPAKKVLQAKLHKAITEARARLELRRDNADNT